MSWILSASRSSARIVDKQGNEFSLVEAIEHRNGRLRDRDVDSDRQGRSHDRMGAARHALSTSEAAHEHDAKGFARELADRMRRARLAGSFERLVLVAEPHFLGLLRDALDPPTGRLVIASVPKDLEQIPVQQLGAHLPELPARAI